MTITRPDGPVEVQAPQKAVRDVPQPRRKKPQTGAKPLPMPTMKQLLTVVCPSCGRKVDAPCTIRQGHRARVELYWAVKGQRSTPAKVVATVQNGVEVREEKLVARRQPVPPEEQAKRAAQREAAKENNRRKGSRGNPYRSANTRAVPPAMVKARRCRRCGAAPGEPCNAQLRNGGAAFHLERVQDARRDLQAKLDEG
ncbi:zinc finger domain-containing protein [Streptomyces eurythermus]